MKRTIYLLLLICFIGCKDGAVKENDKPILLDSNWVVDTSTLRYFIKIKTNE